MRRETAAMVLLLALCGCGGDTFEGAEDAGDAASDVGDALDDTVGLDGGGSDHDAGADSVSDVADVALPKFKRVFITAETYLANLGGTVGADAKCQAAATKAGLPGTYMAWLSTSTSSPKSRFTPSAVPYQLVDGTTVAVSFQSMVTLGTLLHPIDRDENDNAVVFDAQSARGVAWTQTKYDGTYAPPGGCSDFTSTSPDDALAGCDNSMTSTWSVCGDYGCALVGAQAGGLSLYCFEQ